jgi:hypothetical protein
MPTGFRPACPDVSGLSGAVSRLRQLPCPGVRARKRKCPVRPATGPTGHVRWRYCPYMPGDIESDGFAVGVVMAGEVIEPPAGAVDMPPPLSGVDVMPAPAGQTGS